MYITRSNDDTRRVTRPIDTGDGDAGVKAYRLDCGTVALCFDRYSDVRGNKITVFLTPDEARKIAEVQNQ